MKEQILALSIFLIVFVGLLTERVNKMVLSLLGAVSLIALNILTFEQAISAVDFGTISLLLGMMVLVDGLRELRLFDYLAVRLGLLTGGNPLWIYLVFGTATALCSAFLDNVTTVLIAVPLVLSLSRGLGLPGRPFILSVIFLSNIGGAATMIGDPPNILIGSQVPHLTFMMFLRYMTLPVVCAGMATLWYLQRHSCGILDSNSRNFKSLVLSRLLLEDLRRQAAELVVPRRVIVRCGTVFVLVLAGFISHSTLELEPAVIAITGSLLLLLFFGQELPVGRVLRGVEWSTLLFFMGLFVVVGALEQVGLLEVVAGWLLGATNSFWVLMMVILWGAAVLSAVVDNIPFVTLMIPIVLELLGRESFVGQAQGDLLWWALALGACFGGNGTLIGASANVVAAEKAAAQGVSITFAGFLRSSLPVTLICLFIASLYLSGLYIIGW